MNCIKIENKEIGEGRPTFIIAEGGINHNGDVDIAKKMVAEAAKSGADVIKFQTHLPECEMLPDAETADYVGESLFDLLKNVELSKDDHVVLKDYASSKGIIFLSTPFCIEAVDMLEDLGVVAYKVGSGELTNWPLLKYIAKTGKPMIISTGMSTLKEIKESIDYINRYNHQLAVLQCTSTYPCAYENVNLNVITKLKNEFNVIVGLSDHSEGIYTSLAAIALGADIIEKHFTIDRNLPGPDQRASIEPHELKDLVRGARAIELALGSTKKVIDEEIAVQRMARESVVSLVEIPENSIIESNMVGVKRPGTGIPAKLLDEIIGKKTTKTIKAGVLLSWNDLV